MTDTATDNPPAVEAMRLTAFLSRRYFAVMRYVLVNVVAFALVGAATLQGWIGQIYDADVTRLTVVIALAFALGLILCTKLLWRADRHYDLCINGRWPDDIVFQSYRHAVQFGTPIARSIQATNLRTRLFGEITIVRYLANTLVILGLIGTVIGFIIALSSVDPEIAVNPSAVSPMVANLIEGMSVALYTTLVGAVLSVWLGFCYQLLSSAVRNLQTAIVDLGENEAGPRQGKSPRGLPSG